MWIVIFFSLLVLLKLCHRHYALQYILLQWWTGGSLLSRDREFIVLYRGKDFLPAAVSSAIEERRKHEFDLSKASVGNLSIVNEQGCESTVNEHAVGAEQDEENDHKFQERIKMRKAKSAEAAMERTSTKLSMVRIDQRKYSPKSFSSFPLLV